LAYRIFLDDCLHWAIQQPDNSIHAIVTDPPFGHREYSMENQAKLRAGKGGVWRLPPAFDGSNRKPLPRFTDLTAQDLIEMADFFSEWGKAMYRVLVPGAHVLVAGNPILSHIVWISLESAGFEKRGEVVRLVRTFRGGDRPKGAHDEFPDVCTMPRSSWEPWGLFRKPCEGLVAENLRKWKTGALRRISIDTPFLDVIKSGRTPGVEKEIADHPSLKPQHFMRKIVRASLPLGVGVVLDPFMGGGSTIAAAEALGYQSIGVEKDPLYYEMAKQAIPRLANIEPILNGDNGNLSLFTLE